MSVIMDREPEVAFLLTAWSAHHVLSRPQQFHHGEGKVGEMQRVGGPAVVEEIAKSAGIGRRRQRNPESGRDLPDAIPTPGRADDAPNGWTGFLGKIQGHGHIGGNHETFNDVLSDVVRCNRQVFYLSMVDYRNRLNRTERQSSLFFSECAQPG